MAYLHTLSTLVLSFAALGASAPGLDLPARRRPAPKAARAARPRRTR